MTDRLRVPHGHRPRLRVKEQDGVPIVEGVREIRLTNGSLTNEGNGVVSIATGDAGAIMAAHEVLDTGVHGAGASTLATEADIATHAGAADPHTGYVLESLLTTLGDLPYRALNNWGRLPGNATTTHKFLRQYSPGGIVPDAPSWAVVDASEVTFTPAVATDWDGDTDPGDLDDAVNQLAERTDDLEGVDPLTADEHTAIGNSAPHHAAVTLGAGSDAALSLNGQELTLADVLTPAEHTAIGDAAPHHARYADAEAIAAVEGEATLDLAGDVTIAGTKALAVDHINEKTANHGVVIDGVKMKDNGVYATDGAMYIGTNDTIFGQLYLYGHATGSTQGGQIMAYLAADHDTAFGYYTLEVYEDDLRVAHDSANDLVVRADRSIEIPTGPLLVNAVNEYTAGSGVTVDGMLIKDKTITIDSAPDADHTASGPIASLIAGTNLTFGQACYIGADGKMELTDADAVASTFCWAMALATIAEDAAGLFALPNSFIRDDTWNWTVGAKLYLDTATAGGLTETAPSGTDDVAQVVAIAVSADVIYFNPSLSQVVHV